MPGDADSPSCLEEDPLSPQLSGGQSYLTHPQLGDTPCIAFIAVVARRCSWLLQVLLIACCLPLKTVCA